MTVQTAAPTPQECVLAVIRRHWLGLAGTAVRAVIAAAVLGCIGALVDHFVGTVQPWHDLCMWAFCFLCAAVAGWLLLGRFRAWSAAEFTLTNSRIRISYQRRLRGWEIPLSTIVDVQRHSGPIQRIFGVGDLSIQTNFAPRRAIMRDVGSVKSTEAEILTLRNQYLSMYPWSRPTIGHDWNVQRTS